MDERGILAGRYELGQTIGRGGMAEVHIGHDRRLGRTVAVKVLRSDLARDPAFLNRFRREAQAAAALNHPAIVAVYDTGETESEFGALPYIVMEYVDGQTLREIVLPAALPQILTGMRISLAISLILAILGEMIVSNDGLGYFTLLAAFFCIPFAGRTEKAYYFTARFIKPFAQRRKNGLER